MFAFVDRALRTSTEASTRRHRRPGDPAEVAPPLAWPVPHGFRPLG